MKFLNVSSRLFNGILSNNSLEKDYALKKFIRKETIKINEKIENENIENLHEKFANINIDEQIINKIQNRILAKKSNDNINIKDINQKNFFLSIINIKIENIEENSLAIMLKWVMIKGEFNIIKKYIITSYHNCIKQVKYEERKSDLNINEFDKITKLLTNEINNEFKKIYFNLN